MELLAEIWPKRGGDIWRLSFIDALFSRLTATISLLFQNLALSIREVGSTERCLNFLLGHVYRLLKGKTQWRDYKDVLH